MTLLTHPLLFNALGNLLGADACRRQMVREYLPSVTGKRILDIGCGTGELLRYLPGAEYVGIDLSEPYILHARKRHGSRGQFICGDALSAAIPGSFDIAIAWGILHHLGDDACRQLLNRIHT